MRRTLGEGDASILILILPQSSRRGPGHRKVIARTETSRGGEGDSVVIMGQGPGDCSIHPAACRLLPILRPLALSVEAIYVSAYPTAWQLQAMCGSRSPSRQRVLSLALQSSFGLLLTPVLRSRTEVSLLAAAQQLQEQQCSLHLSSYQAAKRWLSIADPIVDAPVTRTE